ncbi:Na+/H+ antiporter subunit E [Aquincola tertiaricarbonis]|uniref:Na+/H+ antiporter subunit E n=1 Tax=Aquincola tertiaricarbonis TaxID=391953 RepID=A0ABY4SD84_AQUTE|nr:Na+/H+ antiporter subunit E [Aquincola tertiaricarbonis]URI09194.1 Na+/H+ antiporter subunit E [Aquincola tertiaricarbonis]
MMRRLLPAPLLSALLLLLWLLLADSASLGQWLLGAVVALGAPLLTASLRPGRVKVGRPGVVLRLLARVVRDVVGSNLRVLHGVLRGAFGGPQRWPRSGFVQVPITLRDPNALAALAIILAVIPGTVWCELSPDGRTLLLHVFDLGDEAALVAEIQQHYERPLQEIFE